MHLSAEAFEQFARLQSALNNFIYGQLQQAAGRPAVTPFRDLPLQKQLEVRDAFVSNPEYVERFVAENPCQLSSEELQIVFGWRAPLAGKFYLLKHLKKHSIFLSTAAETIAYGVVGLTRSIEKVVLGSDLPLLVTAVLLPFRNQIVYDGLLAQLDVTITAQQRKQCTADYNRAKERPGVITSLPKQDEAAVILEARPARKKAAAKPTPTQRAKKAKTAASGD